jgi:hypothetical protein
VVIKNVVGEIFTLLSSSTPIPKTKCTVFSDQRPLLFFSDNLAAAYTPNVAYLLFYKI